MFEFINNENERGQVGIGTLIVFIAMVLVAAIAAGVLINTAGFLQSQAEATGEDSTDLVSERIDVTSTVGIVSDDHTDGNLSEIRIGVSGAAGSDQIDLSESTIEAVGPSGQENLIFENPNSGNVSDLEAGEFGVEEDGSLVSADSAVLDGDSKLTIVLNPATSPFVDDGHAFGEGESSSLDIVSPSSATTSTELTSPDLYSEDGEAVRL